MKLFGWSAMALFMLWVLVVFTAGIPRDHVPECVRIAGAIPVYGNCR